MHDPSVLVLSIIRPYPKRAPYRDSKRFHSLPRWSWRLPLVTVAGRGFYFPSLMDVWHEEPDGRDAGEVCGYPHGRELLAHLRHLRVVLPPVLALSRKFLTRCSWCGQGQSRRKGPVNSAHSWNERGRWWQPERGLYHSGCSAVASAHRTCVCAEPLVRDERFGGKCGVCGHYRLGSVIRGEAGLLATRLLASVPEGALPDAETSRRVRVLRDLERREREARLEREEHEIRRMAERTQEDS